MMINKLVFGTMLLFACFFVLAPTVLADFNPLEAACENLPPGSSPESTACEQAKAQRANDPISGPDGVLKTAARLLAFAGGIASVVLIMLGGFYYVTSGGDPQKISNAKTRVLAGVIGLIVVVSAWLLISFVSKVILQF